jgi:hypothetical protein
MDGATGGLLILGSLRFPSFVPFPAGPGGRRLGVGEGGPQPKEKVLWTWLSGTCGGHVAGPWSPGATSPACEALCGFPSASQLLGGREV